MPGENKDEDLLQVSVFELAQAAFFELPCNPVAIRAVGGVEVSVKRRVELRCGRHKQSEFINTPGLTGRLLGRLACFDHLRLFVTFDPLNCIERYRKSDCKKSFRSLRVR